MVASVQLAWRRGAALLLLFILALAVRTFRAFQEVIANPDLMRFVDQMQSLQRDFMGTLRLEVYHPLHAALGLITHQTIGGLFADERMGWLWSLRITGIVCGAILAVQITRLARWLGAPFWAAMASGVVWIVGRRTSVYGSDGLSDALALCLFVGGLLHAMPALRLLQRGGGVKAGVSRWIGAGVLSGLSYLARPEGAAAALILIMAILLLATGRGRAHAGRRFKLFPRRRMAQVPALGAAGLVVAGFLMPALPYMAVIGGFTGKKGLIWFPPTAAVPAQTGPGDISGLWEAVKTVTNELQETFTWAPWLVVLLALILAPRLWGRARLRVLVVVWILVWDVVMYWLIGRAGYLDGRHTLPVIVLLHAMFGLALVACTRPMAWWMSRRRRDPAAWAALPHWRRWRGWPRASALVLVLLAVLPGLSLVMTEPPRHDKTNLRAAADWIASQTRREVVVCDYQRLVGYYSGRRFARWRGFDRERWPDNPRLEELASIRVDFDDAPLLIGKVYYPEKEAILPAIGQYREVARFASTSATNRDVYVLYARPEDAWTRTESRYGRPERNRVSTMSIK